MEISKNWINGVDISALIFLFIPVLFFGSVLTFGLAKDLNPIVFISLPALLIAYILGNRQASFPLKLSSRELGFLALLVWMFLSFFWATDPSKVLYLALGYSCLYIYMLAVKNADLSPATLQFISRIFCILFIVLLFTTFFIIINKIPLNSSLLGAHRNKVSASVLSLFPFLLFTLGDQKFFKALKLITGIVLFFILLNTNCRGGILALIAILMFYFSMQSDQFPMKKVLMTSSLLVVIAFLLAFIPSVKEFITSSRIYVEFFDANEFDRLYMVRNSIWLFLENPFSGVGLGNWRLEAYANGFADFSYASEIFSFRTLSNHNIYTELLGELGFPGLFLFLFIFLWPVIHVLRNHQTYTKVAHACCGSIITFLISSFFYSSAFLKSGSFSPLFLLAVFSLAILISETSKNHIVQLPSKYTITPVLLTLLSCLSFFCFELFSEHKIEEYKGIRSDSELYIDRMVRLYTPLLKTDFNFYSIPQMIGYHSRGTPNHSRTERYYEESISFRPYDVNILYEYANNLYTRLNNPDKALTFARRTLKIHPNHLPTRVLLAQMALDKNQLEDAMSFLTFPDEIENKLTKMKNRSFSNLSGPEMNLKAKESLSLKALYETQILKAEIDSLLSITK